MLKRFAQILALFITVSRATQAEVLIVADEFPAMQVIADKLKRDENLETKLVWQTNLPPALAPFQAVIVYIHKELSAPAEDAFIEYAENGGKLVVLHHSISSGKRKNRRWFSFLGVALPEGELNHGGYKWIEGVDFDLVNLATNHFIMTNKLSYPKCISFASASATNSPRTLPVFTLHDTEVYLNHVHTEPHELLMGLKYTDAKTGITYAQDRAGWAKRAGKGWIIYFAPGHTQHDFEDPNYGQLVVNAVIWRP